MMTRKHFEAAAETFLKIVDLKTRKIVAEEAVKMFANDNPRFNKNRFLAACGLDND